MAPEAAEYDRISVFPQKTFAEFGERGFLGMIVPADYGGTGIGTMGYCLLSEALGRLSAGYHHNGIFQTQYMILNYGTEAQKKRFLPGLAVGRMHAATAISEPEMGSSFARMETTARKTRNGYILNGIKSHINDAAEADVMNVFAQTDKGLTVFLLEKGTAGFKIGRKLDPMGLRASPIYEFELKNCLIPKENLLGGDGQGSHGSNPELRGAATGGKKSGDGLSGNSLAYSGALYQAGGRGAAAQQGGVPGRKRRGVFS